jgi:hypothetical protein
MNPDFVDLLRSLLAADARFMVVGAYAVGVHGRPRATKDLDIWVEPSAENAPKVIDILTKISGPSFAEAWPGRTHATFGEGVRCAVRPQDLADVDALEKLRALK